jgi:urease accessory protein
MSPPGSGARGHLHVECQADSDGRTFLAKQSFRTPIHLSKPHWDGKYLIINVVNPTAGLFAGDHAAIIVHICAGAWAVLTTPSATRVFRARHPTQRTEIVQTIVVENGGRLDVCPDILIAHGGARLFQVSRIEVHAGGELFFTEMLAPGRTASGEAFAYDELEFSTDLIVGSQFAVRERYCLDARSEGLQSMRRRFPCAYYASSLVVSAPERWEFFQREIEALNDACVIAGASRPANNVYAIKVVAADSMSLRAAISKLRAIVYSHWESPEPSLRKL